MKRLAHTRSATVPELVFPGNHQDDIYMRSEDLDGRGKNVSLAPVVGDSEGQGSSALSRPMRDDSPAARITPQKLKDRPIIRR